MIIIVAIAIGCGLLLSIMGGIIPAWLIVIYALMVIASTVGLAGTLWGGVTEERGWPTERYKIDAAGRVWGTGPAPFRRARYE